MTLNYIPIESGKLFRHLRHGPILQLKYTLLSNNYGLRRILCFHMARRAIKMRAKVGFVCVSPARNDGLRIHSMRILYSICLHSDYFHLAGARIYFYCCFFSGNGVARKFNSVSLRCGWFEFISRTFLLGMASQQRKHLPKIVTAHLSRSVARSCSKFYYFGRSKLTV